MLKDNFETHMNSVAVCSLFFLLILRHENEILCWNKFDKININKWQTFALPISKILLNRTQRIQITKWNRPKFSDDMILDDIVDKKESIHFARISEYCENYFDRNLCNHTVWLQRVKFDRDSTVNCANHSLALSYFVCEFIVNGVFRDEYVYICFIQQ